MAPPVRPRIVINGNDDANQVPKDGNGESIDDVLANVEQFIDSVYRDLSMSPPCRFSSGSALRTRRSVDLELPTSSSPTSAAVAPSASGIAVSEISSNEASPVRRRNMDAEIERINQICDSVDQNLRSIGLIMGNSSHNRNPEDISNTNFENAPSSSTLRTTRNSNKTSQKCTRNRRAAALGSQLVDLSNSQAEEPVELLEINNISNRNVDGDDDDVILVSANIPPVVDLCTPNRNQEMPRPTLEEDEYSRTPLRRRRRTESSFITSPPKLQKPSGRERTSRASGTPFMCPVCMESCLQHHPTSTLCGHVFCKECINRAIALTHKCPMCNKKISKKQTFRIYL